MIAYGVQGKWTDVTEICMQKLKYDNYIIIPNNDVVRANLLGDPLHSILKSISFTNADGTTEYNETCTIFIDLSTNTVLKEVPAEVRQLDPREKLATLQKSLMLLHGSFSDEFPEQLMAVRYLTGKEKVLEIGGNIGRNSLIIGSLLENKKDMVVLECDPGISRQLTENRDVNHLSFQIEASALSKRRLIQKGWDTIVSDVDLPGYHVVPTLTYEELMEKYKIPFDTLVLDCEGAFYYILQDMPEILNGIQRIIMENDYHNYNEKEYVDKTLHANGFEVEYKEAGGWGPCYSHFFEVWKRV